MVLGGRWFYCVYYRTSISFHKKLGLCCAKLRPSLFLKANTWLYNVEQSMDKKALDQSMTFHNLHLEESQTLRLSMRMAIWAYTNKNLFFL